MNLTSRLYNRRGYVPGEWQMFAVHVDAPGSYLVFDKFDIRVEDVEGKGVDQYVFVSPLDQDVLLSCPGPKFRSEWVEDEGTD